MVHTYKRIGHPTGEARLTAKLKAWQVIEIFYSLEKEEYLASLYNVSRVTIGEIRRKRVWRHLLSGLSNSYKTEKETHEDT